MTEQTISIEIQLSPLVKKLLKRANDQPYPKRSTAGSAGFDVMAAIEQNTIIEVGERQLIPSGLFLKMPDGLVADVRPRSGLALKQGLTLLNTPGTIDSDYRGEIGVIMINHGKEAVTIEPLARVAQIVFLTLPKINMDITTDLSKNNHKDDNVITNSTALPLRGTGGFGSTG
ncbi:MAG: dUTP diphosphatase [Alphaproteobacteria bacterium]